MTYPRVDKITADWMPELEISKTKLFPTHFRGCNLSIASDIICVFWSITELDGNVYIRKAVVEFAQLQRYEYLPCLHGLILHTGVNFKSTGNVGLTI